MGSYKTQDGKEFEVDYPGALRKKTTGAAATQQITSISSGQQTRKAQIKLKQRLDTFKEINGWRRAQTQKKQEKTRKLTKTIA